MKNRGVTLLEALMAAGLLTLVVGSVMLAVIPITRSESHLTTEMRLYETGRRALQRIVDDLRQAGVGSIDSATYPHLFCPWDPDGGAVPAGADFSGFNTLPGGVLPPLHEAVVGDPDYGATTQIVFRLPQDLDGNGTATDQVTGLVEWTGQDLTYCLVRNPQTGANELRRYSDYGAGVYETLVAQVERVLFERNDDSGQVWESDLLSANGRELRVTIQLRAPDPVSGAPVRVRVQTTVNLRN